MGFRFSWEYSDGGMIILDTLSMAGRISSGKCLCRAGDGLYVTSRSFLVVAAASRSFSNPDAKSGRSVSFMVPPLPTTMKDLQKLISAAINSITPDTLHKVWLELDYRLNVFQVTGGVDIKCS
ncbi:hypothetical protein AVEN_64642-1 [Araneus ventricosus]|uniref:Uncharacterized protein n=1 Tax=Araneus ventricosus TaxID=182803 RepID=A0A4Y2HZM4_ARAVE|nr:hypothetical protein AVEN_64642-1 [Araneus ventricosus]